MTIAVRGRLPLARNESERRLIVRVVVERAARALLMFALADEHLHALLEGTCLGLVVREVRRALRRLRPDLELHPAHLEPVESRLHLRRLVDYLLVQPRKHGLAAHPALWTGACFADMVGARLLPGFDPRRLLVQLPRFRLREAYHQVALDPVPLEPFDDARMRRCGPARLLQAALAVHALGPELPRSGRLVTHLRALVARTGRSVGFSTGDLASLLGIGDRASGVSRPTPSPTMRTEPCVSG